MAATLRVGVAGAGFIGMVHARAYKQISGVELVGIADPVDEKAESLAREVGCQRFYSYEDMLEQANLDIISICLPPEPHLPAAQAAAQAGVHLVMEKPITRTLEEADRMISACQDAGVYLMTGFYPPFLPGNA